MVASRYGFVPDPSCSAFRNAVRARASSSTSSPILPIPSKLAFHDLTEGQVVKPEAKALLGLGSKFIPAPKFTTSNLESNIVRMARDFSLKVFFAGDDMDENELYRGNSKLFVKSNWTPRPNEIPAWVTTRLSRFFARARNLYKRKRAKLVYS